MSTSLNKCISETGFCSRRAADEYIAAGRVTVNGRVAKAGARVEAGDVVEIDGEKIRSRAAALYLAYNKPKGVTSTTNLQDKTNIITAIGHPQRIFPVGRLDKDSEGLIFLTNDGNIVNKILRAGNRHEKEYIVTVDAAITPEFVKQMSAGVFLPGEGTTLPCKAAALSASAFRIILVQGLNRQIRRMCEALGYKVKTLKRVRIMQVQLGSLPVGHWRYLNAEEVQTIQRMVAESGNEEAASRVAVPEPKPEQQKGFTKPARSSSFSEKKKTDGSKGKDSGSKPQEKRPSKSAAPERQPGKKSGSYKDFRSRRGR